MAKSVEWVDELPAKGGHMDPTWQRELKSRPGKWAIVPLKNSSSSASAYRGEFEFVTRGGKVYGRYIGDGKKG